MKAQVRLLITGRVQGVFFRAKTQQMGRKLAVKGWVRNLDDGGVEVLAEGDKEDLQQIINWCHKGPAGAMVNNVEISWREYEGVFTDFNITY